MTLKTDGSPVTAADQAAEDIILAALAELTPDIPVIAEEATAKGLAPQVVSTRFWLVDPLDGTREFLNGNGEFTVNIALIEDGRPILGVVVAPALGRSYGGGGPGTAFLADAAGRTADRGADDPRRGRDRGGIALAWRCGCDGTFSGGPPRRGISRRPAVR